MVNFFDRKPKTPIVVPNVKVDITKELMHTSADDLLRTRKIPELRSYILTLEKESAAKQSELQHMVGSKYHDFIQSADAIATMQIKAQQLDSSLQSFWESSQDAMKHTKKLLLSTSKQQHIESLSSTTPVHSSSSSQNINKSMNITKVSLDTSSVWECLEDCDIYGAVTIVAVASLLLQAGNNEKNNETLPSYVNEDNKPLLQLSSLIPSSIISESLLRNCVSVLFLKKTVANDARLVLMDGCNSPSDIARTIASIGLLLKMNKSELMLLHLEWADILIDNAIKGLDVINLDPAEASSKLSIAVITLQRTILDIYYLFFKPVQHQANNNNNNVNTKTSSGLLSVFQSLLISDIQNHLQKYVGSDIKINSTLDNDNDNNNNDVSNNNEARVVFDKWLLHAVKRVTQRSAIALESMQSATDVAHLQQRIYQCSTNINELRDMTVPNQSIDHITSVYSQTDWIAACAELLLSPKQRARRQYDMSNNTISEEDPSSLLWSIAFRTSFISQVERLLRESCIEILSRTKAQIIISLAEEGLIVDPITLSVSIAPIKNINSNNLQKKLINHELCSSSPRLYKRAESVRSLLEAEVTDLVTDIILHVQEGDPQSSSSLAKTLLVQCAQLAGHVAIVLRVISTSIIDLYTDKKCVKHIDTSNSSNELKTNIDINPNSNLLLSGTLLIGRIAWLLKIRGRFFEDALLPLSHSSNNQGINNSPIIEQFTSEEQMKSAFEIADTDGDGYVTYNEAIEAIQALALGDSVTDSQRASQCPFLSPSLTPSLSFGEFSLLCCHFQSMDEIIPIKTLQTCIEDIAMNTHLKWAEKLVTDLSVPLINELNDELGLTAMKRINESTNINTNNSTQGLVLLFKSNWQKQSVEMDTNELGESIKEEFSMPAVASSALVNFLFNINKIVSASILSIDTIQRLPPFDSLRSVDANNNNMTKVDANNNNNNNEIQLDKPDKIDRLAQYATTNINNLLFKAIANAYTVVLRDASSIKTNNTVWLEDCSLQVTFDLMVCLGVSARCGITTLPKSLRLCISGWRSKLDPINVELMTPLLTSISTSYASKTYLLFPCQKALPKVIKEATINNAGNTDIKSINSNDTNGIFSSSLFNNAQSSRFALLPLSISQGLNNSFRDKNRLNAKITDKNKKILNNTDGKSISQGDFKNINNHYPEAQAAGNNGYIGNKLMSSIGSIWGGNS